MKRQKYTLGEMKAACSKLNINFGKFWSCLSNDTEQLTYDDYAYIYPFKVDFGDENEQLHPDEQLS